MSSTSSRTIERSSAAFSWIRRSTMISSTISAIWWRSSSGPSDEATEMSMRCISIGITCAFTCSSRLLLVVRGAAAAADVGQRVLERVGARAAAVAPPAAAAARALGVQRRRRCRAAAGAARSGSAWRRAAPTRLLEHVVGHLGELQRASPWRGPRPERLAHAARSRPSAASTANRWPAAMRPASKPSSMARLLPLEGDA